MDERKNFVITEEDWSLHQKGYDDQKRHQEKVKEVIKQRLPELISEESIVMSDGKRVVKVPVRSLNEYKIRYNYDKNKHAGQGKGDSKVGDVVSKGKDDDKAQGDGSKPGDQPGADYYETDVSIAELEEELFRHLELPDLEDKEKDEIVHHDIEFNDLRKKGLQGNVDKRRTLKEALKRNIREGNQTVLPILPDDLRFKTWEDIEEPDSKAVVFAMMDTSGSMGLWEKYMARSFFFWTSRFLKKKYDTVVIEFIAHHTEAKVVSEEDFFSKGESGGTICSSAYTKALELIDDKYNPSSYNIYPIHFSDGDNLTSDNRKCLKLVEELMEHSQMFGYGEVNQYNRHSTLMSAYSKIEDPKFRHYILRQKTDVFYAMKELFKQGEAMKV
ncbi:sporulation protein YhbH [Salirhabdus salicampi]|uniref:sporulation protein YhbH n=1 Tax=Salirhabdus salicampi TaxID=476102 RepID=UPI0020C2D345|nr:sporulation protein YhbH [Salirhabdus salicampi]MCP8615301.1 sporulation protein YhbH [Salirhabdus salicampi]